MVEASNIIVIIVTALGAVVSFAYVFTDQRRASKKPLYLWKGIVLVYFTVVYLVAAQADLYIIRSGLATRWGLIVMTSLVVASVIVDWRRR